MQPSNVTDQYICLSRPRRFGKSMAAHLLMAYYSRGADSRELFKDKKIYSDQSSDQIKRREYPEALEGVTGEILLVGIDYSTDPVNPDYKHHTCKIERWTR